MKILYRSILLLPLLCICIQPCLGQSNKYWSLKECIEYATSHNFQAAQTRLQLERSKVSLLQTKGNALPSLNGSANHTYNTGRRIDPFTNQFANSSVLSQNFSLSSGLTLFSGLQNTHTLRAGQLAVQSALAGNEQVNNDIALGVANAFLEILLAEELTLIAGNQVELSKDQVKRARSLYEAGRTAKGEYLQAEAQLASEELNLVNNRNRFALAKLNLAQMLTLEAPEEFEIERPSFSDDLPDLPPFNAREIYNSAVEQFPAVRSADLNHFSQERLLKANKAALLPTLSAFGGIGTGYSQLSRTQVGSTTQQQYLGDFQGTPIIIDVNVPVFEKTQFADQWTQNFNRTVGFSLNVPLFNNFRTRSMISTQKIAVENARIQKMITRNKLLLDIQSAWFGARAAFERYKATEKNVAAMQESFEYISQRYDAGLVNSFEYTTGKNQLAAARSNLAQAKYEYILRNKVLDFYRGRPIEL
jgi:outer membrane protein